jgi:predicted O-methyltransferase YrrM
MPTSHPHQLNEIVNLTTLLKPKKVMEIGVGFGKYGLLLREYLEIWGEGEVYKDWLRKIDGIEIFEST